MNLHLLNVCFLIVYYHDKINNIYNNIFILISGIFTFARCFLAQATPIVTVVALAFEGKDGNNSILFSFLLQLHYYSYSYAYAYAYTYAVVLLELITFIFPIFAFSHTALCNKAILLKHIILICTSVLICTFVFVLLCVFYLYLFCRNTLASYIEQPRAIVNTSNRYFQITNSMALQASAKAHPLPLLRIIISIRILVQLGLTRPKTSQLGCGCHGNDSARCSP